MTPLPVEARSAVERFALLCLRGRADPGCLETARELTLRPDFDWGAFLQFAIEERLTPLLYHTLRDREITPLEIETNLRDNFDYTARRNLFLLHELQEVLDGLTTAGIEAVIFKGAALAEHVYQNIALRPMSDLDLLIRRDHLSAAIEAIGPLGYERDYSFNVAWSMDYESEVPFTKLGIERVVLDIHWRLFSWTFYIQAMPMAWFWETARPAEFGRSPALILGPEAQVLYLCWHATKHGFGKRGLLWIFDIAEVIQLYQAKLDWDLLLAQAQAGSLVLPIQQLLPQVAEELGAPVPDDVLARCRHQSPTPGEKRILEIRSAEEITVAHRVWFDLTSLPGWRQRLHYLTSFALNRFLAPPAYMVTRYQIRYRILLPLYYLYRLSDALYDGIKFALRR